jgi:hypothetical protein
MPDALALKAGIPSAVADARAEPAGIEEAARVAATAEIATVLAAWFPAGSSVTPSPTSCPATRRTTAPPPRSRVS